MNKLIILILTIGSSFSLFGQYTQNLDTLSRKEIKQIILSQNDSPKAKNLMEVHQGLKYISYISYSFAGISLLSRIHAKGELDKLLTISVGAVFASTGLILTAISKKTYKRAVKVYTESFPSTISSSVFIRDSRSIYLVFHH